MKLLSTRALRVVVHGVLWGVASSALEWLALPQWSGTSMLGTRMLFAIAPAWCGVGIGLAACIELAGPRMLRPAFLAFSVLACAFVLSGVWSVLYALPTRVPGGDAMDSLFPSGTNALAAYCYQAWVIVFYGGLYFFAWTVNYRAERTRALLAEAQVARIGAETMLGESQLATLREGVDPVFLLHVLSEAERRYATDDSGADRLIGRLVTFLRLAMPGVRSGRSTLAAELRLGEAYAVLRNDASPSDAAWSIEVPAALPDIPMPPMFVATLLESLASAGLSHVYLGAAVEGDRVALRIAPPVRGNWLSPDREYRVRVGFSTLYGNDWTFTPAACGAEPMLTVPMRVPKPTREAIHA